MRPLCNKGFRFRPKEVIIGAMYNKTVLDHFENPRNIGEIADADGVAVVGNPECGGNCYQFHRQ